MAPTSSWIPYLGNAPTLALTLHKLLWALIDGLRALPYTICYGHYLMASQLAHNLYTWKLYHGETIWDKNEVVLETLREHIGNRHIGMQPSCVYMMPITGELCLILILGLMIICSRFVIFCGIVVYVMVVVLCVETNEHRPYLFV